MVDKMIAKAPREGSNALHLLATRTGSTSGDVNTVYRPRNCHISVNAPQGPLDASS